LATRLTASNNPCVPLTCTASTRCIQVVPESLAEPISGLITLSVHTDHDFSATTWMHRSRTDERTRVFSIGAPRRQQDSLTLRDVASGTLQGVLRLSFVGTADRSADQMRVVQRARGRRRHGLGTQTRVAPSTISSTRWFPQLQRRGLFPHEYTGDTRRDLSG